MNIFQTVIDAPAASAADITDAGGFITITGLSKPIPKGSIVSARRVVVGEKPQVYTIAVATPGSNVTYQISVTGKSPVTGIMKTWTANYSTGASAPSAATLGAAFVASMNYTDAPFTASGTSTITITAKSGTPNISVVSSNATVLPVVNATPNLLNGTNNTAGTGFNIAAATAAGGVATGIGTALTAQFPVGSAFYAANNAGTVALTGYVSGNTSDTVGQVVPGPNVQLLSATPTFANCLFLMDNTGLALENTYAYASLPGVTLTPAFKYVVYEIDALDRLNSGNGARPDAIMQKYVIYVKSTDANVWRSSNGTGTGGFDATLATVLGTTF
jgi:hypothetical protein